MSRFNSSISVVGITEPKVQQAFLKLLENSLALQEQIKRYKTDTDEQIRLLKQKVAQIGGE